MKTKGKIGVSTQDLFPIIKKFLYSDHEIFLRELVSNAVDATQKLKTLASTGEFKGNVEGLRVTVTPDPKAGTLTISDNGIGMTAEEVDKYINQIAFSGAEEFMKKYKDNAQAIIGHFGLGFYSAFMVSDKVEIVTRSYKEDAPAVRWSCTGTTDFTMAEAERAERGTDVILYLSKEEKEFSEEERVEWLLRKYCRFLPVEIVCGKEKEWKDGAYHDTDRDLIVNDTHPAWTRKPSELKAEDYEKFYHDLYPAAADPLFHIHLNVDYPFTLTGLLYFPQDQFKAGIAEKQDSALQQPGLCDRFGGRHRARLPDVVARRHRLARHPAQRVAFVSAERPQRQENLVAHHQKGGRQHRGAV